MEQAQVLVAIDLSDESEEVLTMATQLARDMEAALHVVTIVQPVTGLLGDYEFVPVDEGMLAFEDVALEMARMKLNGLAEQFDVPASKAAVKVGKPATEIRDHAKSLNASMVILGNHRRHGVGRLLGSTAHAVLNDASYDVLVVNIHPHVLEVA